MKKILFQLFGVVLSNPPACREGFYGNGQTFVFKFTKKPEKTQQSSRAKRKLTETMSQGSAETNKELDLWKLECFNWAGSNNLFISCGNDHITIGGDLQLVSAPIPSNAINKFGFDRDRNGLLYKVPYTVDGRVKTVYGKVDCRQHITHPWWSAFYNLAEMENVCWKLLMCSFYPAQFFFGESSVI